LSGSPCVSSESAAGSTRSAAKNGIDRSGEPAA
jgi:hypothetical protein